MNREIKFRGRNNSNNKLEWVYGDLIWADSHTRILPKYSKNLLQNIQVIPHSIGQFTGLLDKNGKEIYEGDLVKFTTIAYEVFYNSKCGKYDLKHHDGEIIIFAPEDNSVEIIGNIYDNNDLLNTK
jgi:uncharacterized phage protein (TIGR01671 family)